jgi:hypothetical protein
MVFLSPSNQIPTLDHGYFLPNLFQFIILQSTYHPTLHSLDNAAPLNNPPRRKKKLWLVLPLVSK